MVLHNLKVKFSLLLFVLITMQISAQDTRTLETKVADLLVQMPTNNIAHRNQLMRQITNWGKEIQTSICQQIVKPGTGEDTKARFAIESYSKFMSFGEQQQERVQWERLMIKFIDQSSDKEVKKFFIRQLEFVGGQACLNSLSKLLPDKILAAAAVKSMVLSSPQEAATYFESYLDTVSDDYTKIMLIKGIAKSTNPKNADKLIAIYPLSSASVKKHILKSLSIMPSTASLELLKDEAKAAKYKLENTEAVISLLDYSKTIATTNKEMATTLARMVLKKSITTSVRIKSMVLLSHIADETERDKIFMEAMKDKNKTYRGAAIEEAIRSQSSYPAALKTLTKTKNTEVQQEILYLLGKIKNNTQINSILPFLNSKEDNVRREAVITYALLAKNKSIKELLKYVTNNPQTGDLETATQALMLTISKENITETFEYYDTLPTHGKIALLNIWGMKKATKAFDLIMKGTQSTNSTLKNAAYNNLKNVSEPDNLEMLLKLFESTTNNSEIDGIAQAIIIVVKKDTKDQSIQRVNHKAKTSSNPTKYIPIFSAVGSKDAIQAVLTQYEQSKSTLILDAFINWGDHHASNVLFELYRGNTLSSADRSKVFKGYVTMVGKSSLPADQKLLLLRKIIPYTTNNKEKANIITALADVKTFLSFLFVSNYLDDDTLRNTAANSLSKIALPGAGKTDGLTGRIIVEGLNKSKKLITGTDSQYLEIDIGNYLSGLNDEEGFVSMFNGKNLDGWQGFVANPVKKKELSKQELAKLQKEADEKMYETWSVRNGTIVFNGKGYNLCSIKEYKNFEMVVDWRITRKGDSGIYLRGTPQIQVWDTSRVEVGAQVGSGGLYNNQKNDRIPLVVADNPINDWNTFHIKMIGERVTVFLNGLLVVDNVILENYWNRELPIFPKGSIELQAHGTDLAFRNIYIKEISSNEYNLSAEEKKEGFSALFNGTDLTGWIGNKTDYFVANGEITIQPKNGGHGNLYTEKEYADFNYRFEFKLTPGANNGLGIRTPSDEGDPAYIGMEIQILDNTAPVYAHLKPYQYHGSVYGVISSKRGFLKPLGQWNSQEVIVKGNYIKIILNGEIIVDGDIAEASKNGTLDEKNHPGLKRTKGHIGFLGHGSVVYFRNIRIKEL